MADKKNQKKPKKKIGNIEKKKKLAKIWQTKKNYQKKKNGKLK